MPNKITPLKGSPIGRVILNDSERSNTFDEPTIPDPEFGKELTVCYCGLPFHEHSEDELGYIGEHNRCKRVARKAH